MNERPKSLQEVLNEVTAKRPPSKTIEEPDERGLLLDQLINGIDITRRTKRRR